MTLELLTFSLMMMGAQFIPGPDFALVTQSSLMYGAKQGTYCALGIATALLFHCSIIYFGGAYIFSHNNTFTQSILLLGGIWLISIAFQMYHSTPQNTKTESSLPLKQKLFWQAFITNLLNPKCIIFLAALMAPFFLPEKPHWGIFVALLLTIVQSYFLWCLWSYLLHLGKTQKILQRHLHHINKGVALLLVFFASQIFWEIIPQLYLTLFD